MVECLSPPIGGPVTPAAIGLHLAGASKLPGMDIRMAGSALIARRVKYDRAPGVGRSRLVAPYTGSAAMPAKERKRSPAMVKWRGLAPVSRRVALIAGPVALENRAGRIAMGILMAAGAFLPQSVEPHGLRRTGGAMAIGARNRLVAAGQREARFRMIDQGVAHRLPTPNSVTPLTPVLPWRSRKLAAMAVFVATQAGFEGRMEIHGDASPRVAILTSDLGVPSCQWIAGLRMGCAIEMHGLPARLAMAGCALPTVPGKELPFVLIAVAVDAALMRDRRSKVGGRVALPAVGGAMQAEQRELGAAVVERRVAARGLPVVRRVALLTVGRECTSMLVRMTGFAVLVEDEILILNPIAKRGERFVATVAADTAMSSSQREGCLFVLESGCAFPLILGVTLLAAGAECTAVNIVMATAAGLAEPEQCFGKVGLLQFLLCSLRDVLGLVALLAGQPGVPPLQRKPRLPMVEPGLRNTPADQFEGPSVVFSVTPGTVAGNGSTGSPNDLRVIAGLLLQAPANLNMAIQAFEVDAACSKTMAAGTFQCAFQCLVRMGQFSRRHLRMQCPQIEKQPD